MKKLLTGFLLASTSICMAQEEKSHKHCFSPKIFYRYHEEDNYSYKTSGIGFEYSFHKPKGINIKLSGMTNIKDKNILVETEHTLFFRCPIHEYHNLYPILATKNSSHKIDKVDEKDVFINKSTGYVGMGWEWIFSPIFQIHLEGSFSRDIHNILMIKSHGKFWGQSYSNPTGARAKMGIRAQWKDSFFLELEGHYAQTFQECYKECGTEIVLKWEF